MSTFEYNFSEFYEWYIDNLDRIDLFEENKQMAIYIINQSSKYEKLSKKQMKKKETDSEYYLGLFNKNQLTDIAEFKFIANTNTTNKYPNGLYCTIDNKSIYAIHPIIKDNILCTDHFTFMKDNVHHTTYTPTRLNHNIGNVSHIPKSKLLDGTELPLIGYDTDVFKKHHIYKNYILDIVRAYKKYTNNQTGSGPSLNKTIAKTKTVKVSRERKPDISPLLEKLFIINNITDFKIICIKKDTKCGEPSASAKIMTFAVSSDTTYIDFAFETSNKNWSTIDKKICKILQDNNYLALVPV